jgi:hypothetical protein
MKIPKERMSLKIQIKIYAMRYRKLVFAYMLLLYTVPLVYIGVKEKAYMNDNQKDKLVNIIIFLNVTLELSSTKELDDTILSIRSETK